MAPNINVQKFDTRFIVIVLHNNEKEKKLSVCYNFILKA